MLHEETIVDLSWPEVEKAAKDKAIILFPTGVIDTQCDDSFGGLIGSERRKTPGQEGAGLKPKEVWKRTP